MIRPVQLMYVKYPLSLGNVEELLVEREIDICHEIVRLRWNRLDVCSGDPQEAVRLHACLHPLGWHLDQVCVRINGEMYYLWRAVDREGKRLDVVVQTRRNHDALLALQKRFLGNQRVRPEAILVTAWRPTYPRSGSSTWTASTAPDSFEKTTVGGRTHTCRFDGESGRSSNSRAKPQPSASSPPMPASTIPPTPSDI